MDTPVEIELSIILVNWNSVAYLMKCLDSVQKQSEGLTYEVVVVDSASFDGCDAMMAQNFPEFKFIQSRENLGFAKANNLGFRNSCGENVLFLNPDTEVIGPALKALVKGLKELPDAGLVGCKLLNTDGSVQTSCIQSYPTILNQVLDSEFLRARSPKSSLWGMAALFSEDTKPLQVEAVIGACMLMKRSTFEQMGMFSEDYFMYGEDIDLCYKISKAGYRNYYIPSAAITHHGGKSSEKRRSVFPVVTMRESTWRFMRKFRGRCYAAAYRFSMGACAVMRLTVMAILIPFLMLARSRDSLVGAGRKWLAVLGWSLWSKLKLD